MGSRLLPTEPALRRGPDCVIWDGVSVSLSLLSILFGVSMEAEPGDDRLLRPLGSISILVLLLLILLPFVVSFGAGICALAVAPVWTGSDDDKKIEERSDNNGMKGGMPVCSWPNRVNILESMLSKPGEKRGTFCGEKRGSCFGGLKLD